MRNNRNTNDLNLPLGYRWASAEETEEWSTRGHDLLGQRWVSIFFDSDRNPVPRDEHQADLAVLDGRNLALVEKYLDSFDQVEGPREGDYVEFSDDVVRRFTHRWDEGLQTTDERYGGPSFHLGDGFCSYSGSLRPIVRWETLTRKDDETRPGWVWFWHHGWAGAHRGVDIQVPLRVYQCSLSSGENQ